ncbi:unnamed protein product [Pleuronectes platessa]|uniref:Polycomb group protein RNA binding region domain-containing protein n=1 Tax=Pleuronectes platessa TaxID=8262 RepID=A0A9N7VKT1_PLEPL|nr:unnamed protein product [Pleuronectes platessa]
MAHAPSGSVGAASAGEEPGLSCSTYREPPGGTGLTVRTEPATEQRIQSCAAAAAAAAAENRIEADGLEIHRGNIQKAAAGVKHHAGSDYQTAVCMPPAHSLQSGPPGKVPGRKRGRPPIRKLEFQSHYVEPLSQLKVPKKRGRKPGFKLKPRMVMSLANSSPNSTPEPEMGSVPQDAAIVPHSTTPQVLTAETPMPDDFLCDPPVDSKRYAIDPSDSAFNVMTSQYQTKHSYGYRGSSCSTPMALCRQASSPASFQEANRNGCSSMPDSGECKRPAGKDPSSWGVEEVVWFIKDADPQAWVLTPMPSGSMR